jgi:hypothetical protein
MNQGREIAPVAKFRLLGCIFHIYDCVLSDNMIAIIAEVIISFRSLPEDVYMNVNWSDFIPHV